MYVNLYSVRDVKTGVFLPPMACHNSGHAKRVLMQRLMEDMSTWKQFPGDFQLYSVGTFDDSSGIVKAEEVKFVCEMTELMPPEEPKISPSLTAGESSSLN